MDVAYDEETRVNIFVWQMRERARAMKEEHGVSWKVTGVCAEGTMFSGEKNHRTITFVFPLDKIDREVKRLSKKLLTLTPYGASAHEYTDTVNHLAALGNVLSTLDNQTKSKTFSLAMRHALTSSRINSRATENSIIGDAIEKEKKPDESDLISTAS